MSRINTRLPQPPVEWDVNWARRTLSTLELQLKDISSPASEDAYQMSNVTTDRVLDADSTSIAEIADVLGTLITDLKNKGVIA